jgi:hypothetical protein
METKTMNDSDVQQQGSGFAELVIGALVMIVALGLFVYAFQSAATDGPYTASAWLIAFALSPVGIFVYSRGMRKQRIVVETAKEKADAERMADQAIERARKK